MFFPPYFLDELKSRVGLVEVIGRRVRLRKKGREHIGLCPFHIEKTPSFTVNEDRGIYHCFGCGEYGGVFDFVMKIDNLSFSEAVKKLAAESGMKVPAETPEKRQLVEREMNVSPTTIQSMALDAGQSSKLQNAFSLVAEASDGGEPIFTHQAHHDLKKVIACRTYSAPILELCHLVRIADACPDFAGYLEFFCGPGRWRFDRNWKTVAQSTFRSQVTMAGDMPSFEVGKTGVNVCYPDGQFTVNFGRMPFLSALLEFLITALGCKIVDRTLRPVTGQNVSQGLVSAQANELSKSLYNYLKEHLPAVQLQRKFRRLIGFMNQEKGADFQLGDVDDECIMVFWELVSGEAGDGGDDFKTFTATFKAFVRLCQALEHAPKKFRLNHPAPIGSDLEAGEVDLELLESPNEDGEWPGSPGGGDEWGEFEKPLDLFELVNEDNPNPLLALDDGPQAAIKFINKREFEALEILLESGRTGLGLPLSLMRYEVFGKGQGRISQALRRNAGKRELHDLIDNCGVQTYEEKEAELRELCEHLERALLASLHVLLGQRNTEAFLLMLELAPDADLSPLKTFVKNIAGEEGDTLEGKVVPLRPKFESDAVFEYAADPARVGDDIAGLIKRAGEAFNGISRKGFGRDDAMDPKVGEGFSEGGRHLVQVRKVVLECVEKFGACVLPEGSWAKQFAADRLRFAQQFKFLYGEKL